MSKYANPGELRTPVYFMTTDPIIDDEGSLVASHPSVFGKDVPVYCKWVNAHGTESFTALQLQLTEPATITCRFSPKIGPQLLVGKGDDPNLYEIISVDDVENQHEWLEIKVQRRTSAR